MLDLAIQYGAHAIDIEIESAEGAGDKLHQFNGRAHVIVSYHNFEATPPLDSVVTRVTKIPADFYKVVTTARKPSDNARILAAAKSATRQRMIVLAMGELGFPTRVLSPIFGGVYTYAAPMLAQGTAAGQVSARSLRHIYRVDKLDRASKIYGVIADPVRHSISPAVHNRAFQSRRIDAVYLPFLVSPAHLRDFFYARRAASAGGVQRDHSAQAEDHPLSGYSGPPREAHRRREHRLAQGREMARRQHRCRRRHRTARQASALPKSTVLIVGNGGAARGAAFALSDAGAKIALVGRNADRVRALSKVCNAEALGRDQLSAATSTPSFMPPLSACSPIQRMFL